MSLGNNCDCHTRERRESAGTFEALHRQRRKSRKEREIESAKIGGRRRIDSQVSPDRTRLISTEQCYSFRRQCESRNESDNEFGTPVAASYESTSTRRNSLGGVDARENIYSDRLKRQEEEAKYAKFIYDITQEIMVNGLYTDNELQAIFDKHLRINSGLLERVSIM